MEELRWRIQTFKRIRLADRRLRGGIASFIIWHAYKSLIL